jgi:amino acid transporter
LLRRELGLRDLILFNIAAVVGIRWLAAAAHTGPGSISLWILAAACFFVPSALAVATLSERHPDEGGLYVWTRESFGPWHGFLCGWCYWLNNLFYFPNLLVAGASMALHVAGAAESKPAVVLLSIAGLWGALLANLFGLRTGKWISNLGGAATYSAGGLLILAAGAVWLRSGSVTPLDPVPVLDFARLNFWSQIAFAFGGLELGSVMAAEIRDPKRTIALAAWISGAAITGVYVLGTIAVLVLLPPAGVSVITGLLQAGDAAGVVLGAPWLASLLAVLVLGGVLGQLAAWLGGSARIPFVIGIDRYFPRSFSRVHPRWGTPHVAILVQGVACTLFLAALQAGENLRAGYQLMVDMTVITYFLPYLYIFGASWKHGRRISAASGLGVTLAAIALSLVPPPESASVWLFEAKLIGGCGLLMAAARVVYRRAAVTIVNNSTNTS